MEEFPRNINTNIFTKNKNKGYIYTNLINKLVLWYEIKFPTYIFEDEDNINKGYYQSNNEYISDPFSFEQLKYRLTLSEYRLLYPEYSSLGYTLTNIIKNYDKQGKPIYSKHKKMSAINYRVDNINKYILIDPDGYINLAYLNNEYGINNISMIHIKDFYQQLKNNCKIVDLKAIKKCIDTYNFNIQKRNIILNTIINALIQNDKKYGVRRAKKFINDIFIEFDNMMIKKPKSNVIEFPKTKIKEKE